MDTRKRVMEAIDQLAFIPRAEARAHAMQNTNRIGVLTPFFTSPSFVQRLRGVAAVLSRANYELVIFPVDSAEHMKGYISTIPLRHNIDGLIIMSLQVNEEEAHRLLNNGMETVLIEYTHPQLNSIVIDDEYGGRLAAEYLIGKGHKTFGFIGDIEAPDRIGIRPVRSRLEGFLKAIQAAGLNMPGEVILGAPYTPEETSAAAHELLGKPQRPTAIFAASDIQALSIMKVARQLGMSVPADLAVIGFDDIDVAEHVDLTTIRQHLDESGKLAAEILLSRIGDASRPAQQIHLPLNLIERLSA